MPSGSYDGLPAPLHPASNRANRILAFDGFPPATCGRDCLVPPGRHEPRREVGQRREDEQALAGKPMGDDQVGRFRRVAGASFVRSTHVDPGTAEHEQVEVDLARTPSFPVTSSERPLDLLERDQERGGSRRRIRPRRRVDGGRRIPELGLVEKADGLRRIELRDPTEADIR